MRLTNVEFHAVNAEWIDLPVASVDAVLCRWGYMLMADPPAALAETRRVLRPSGRLALAVWDAVAANPWALLPMVELIERGLAPGGGPTRSDRGRSARPVRARRPGSCRRAARAGAGFTEVHVDAVDVHHRHPSFDVYWETTLDVSRAVHDIVLSRPPGEIDEIRAALATRMQPYTAADGSLELPGARSLVAAASA